MERDRFAVTTPSGRIDYELVEKGLTHQENLANPILQKLRVREAVTHTEKAVLASYISQMSRRIRKTDARRRELAQKWARTMNWQAIVRSAAYAGDFTKALDLVRNPQKYEDEAAENLRKLGTTLKLEAVEAHLLAMGWRILCAPDPKFFVTNDCPALLGENFGLAHPQAVVLFPIASDVALWVSWEKEEDLVYVQANESQVYLANSVMIRNAHREIYAKEKSKWILTELEMLAAEHERVAGGQS